MISDDKETPSKEKQPGEVFTTPKARASVWSFISTATPTTSLESREDTGFKTPGSNSIIRKRKRRVSDYGVKVNQQPITLLTPLKIYDPDKEVEDLVECVKAGSELSPSTTPELEKASISNLSKRRRLSLPMQSFKFSNFDPLTLFDETPKNSVKKTKKRKSLRLPRKSISRIKTPESTGSNKLSTVKTPSLFALKQKTYASSKIPISRRKIKSQSKTPEITLLPNKYIKLDEQSFSPPTISESTNRIVESSLPRDFGPSGQQDKDNSITEPYVQTAFSSDISPLIPEANKYMMTRTDMLPTVLLEGVLAAQTKSIAIPHTSTISDTSNLNSESIKPAQDNYTKNKCPPKSNSSEISVFISEVDSNTNTLPLVVYSNNCIETNGTLEEPSSATLGTTSQPSSATGESFAKTSQNVTQPIENGIPEDSSSIALVDVCPTSSNDADDSAAVGSKPQPSPRRSSRAKIRKSIPKLDIRQTPMGLPRPTREKKEQFSVEEVYLNKNFQTPTEKKWETIFEFPKENKDGSLSNCEKRKKKRRLEFVVDPSQRKPKWKKKKFKSTRRKSKFSDFNIDEALADKLYKLDVALKLADLSP